MPYIQSKRDDRQTFSLTPPPQDRWSSWLDCTADELLRPNSFQRPTRTQGRSVSVPKGNDSSLLNFAAEDHFFVVYDVDVVAGESLFPLLSRRFDVSTATLHKWAIAIDAREVDCHDFQQSIHFFDRYDLPQWAKLIQRMGTAEPDPEQIARVFIAINNHVTATEFSSLNSTLNHIEVARVSSAMLVALIRGTYAYRRSLSGWSHSLSRIRAEIISRGLNADAILFGLSNK